MLMKKIHIISDKNIKSKKLKKKLVDKIKKTNFKDDITNVTNIKKK